MAYSNTTGLPSVTQLLRPYLDTRWFTAESRRRGTIVHNACAAHLKSVWVAPLPADYQGYFDSFRRWADACVEKVLLVESRLVDRRLGYCGQLDMVVKFKGMLSATAVVDIKTGVSVEKSWPVQLAAYRHLAMVDRDVMTNMGGTLRVRMDGSGALWDDFDSGPHPIERAPSWNVFVGLLNAHNYLKGR